MQSGSWECEEHASDRVEVGSAWSMRVAERELGVRRACKVAERELGVRGACEVQEGSWECVEHTSCRKGVGSASNMPVTERIEQLALGALAGLSGCIICLMYRPVLVSQGPHYQDLRLIFHCYGEMPAEASNKGGDHSVCPADGTAVHAHITTPLLYC